MCRARLKNNNILCLCVSACLLGVLARVHASACVRVCVYVRVCVRVRLANRESKTKGHPAYPVGSKLRDILGFGQGLGRKSLVHASRTLSILVDQPG